MTASLSSFKPLPLHKSFAASAIAACVAETLTLPLDTAKVRLQLQSKSTGPPLYKGLLGTVRTIAKQEGPGALWKGLEAGLHRQCLFGGLRIGLYEPVKRLYMGKTPDAVAPFHTKVAAGLTTGALGILIASPTDLVKVRMQSEAGGGPKRYPNARAAYGMIAREEGLLGLWKGVTPNVGRNAIINAAELASYDTIKTALISTGYFEDTIPCHLASGLGAGFFAVCFGSPVDVVKSRLMGDKTGQYSGLVDCFVKSFRTGGLATFYNGFLPNFARLGSWNCAMFLTVEQVKKLFY
ncbi:uncoupling protein [Coccomyxa subellipsoidea C-169]|uniref:Uncoupling protein n=1 Tax=Coccomyxa subellipsoidea (strain C-169) TaxID=574566 RepID=I0Z1Z4_COCSC|nr:uncoupling protein [Coccomyxa subellipsoidea C-169]EIE24663.1 uncoupling protein [Coccomyxa subellipsoidea C-169]|eukprot:XP_005649207.1 uncoupling protein [Coccomyxa subellipsoidea C-169]